MRQVTSSLRIVMIVENNTYPSDPRVRQEAETLADAGHIVTVMCPRKAGQPWRETVNGVHIRRFPRPPNGHGLLGYLLEFGYATGISIVYVLWQWLTAGLDVLHVHNPPDTLFFAGLLPRLAGKKLVYDHHDLSPELYLSKYEVTGGSTYQMLLRLERWSCRAANWVITVNESYRQIDIERNGKTPDEVLVVRNGPNLNRMHLVPPDPEVRSKASTIFAYVGNIAHQDGLDHLLKALSHLDHEFGNQDWYCAIIGRIDEPASLLSLADELGLAKRVWFTGFIPDEQMLGVLSAADICVAPDPPSPLNSRSTMNKVMEYMALGKPIVAYDLTEHRVSAEGAALYATPGDTLDMARQFTRLIGDPELRAQLGAIGRQRIDQELAWPYSAERLLRFYAFVKKVVRGEPADSAEHLQPT